MASLLNNASLLLNPAGSVIAYEEDKIFSVLPTNGDGDFTFLGGDGGTRVNQQGYIEQTPANLTTNSENLSSGWSFNASSIVSTNNTSPINTSNATLITEGTSTTYHRYYSPLFTGVSSGGTYTVSQYVKYHSCQYISLGLGDSSTFRGYMVFDVQNGIIIDSAGQSGGTLNDAGFQNVGGGWYRIWVTVTASSWAGSMISNVIGFQNSSTYSPFGSYTGTDRKIYGWGGQNNNGYIRPYQPTTDRLNYPRITYQNGRGAILNEPQRTNYVLNSNSCAWVTQVGASLTFSSSISPDGTQNATTLNVGTGAYSGAYYYVNRGTEVAPVSIFAKAGTLPFLYFVNPAGNGLVAYYDLRNGTVSNVTAGYNAYIEPYKDGWYRCVLVSPSQTNNYIQIGVTDVSGVGAASYAGNIQIWGGQNEVGPYPTTYIPTTTATVTRPLSYSKANMPALNNGGTWYIDFGQKGTQNLNSEIAGTNLASFYLSTNNNYYPNSIGFSRESNSSWGGRIFENSAYSNFGSINTLVIGPKLAIAFSGSLIDVFSNGSLIHSTISSPKLATAYNTITFNYDSSRPSTVNFSTSAIFDSKLSNTQLQELTTVNSGTGGTISYYGPYTTHTFTGSGTFTPSFNGQVEVLVVAGGGSGGGDVGGGGGGGQVLYNSSYGVSAGTGITVTIGAGGGYSTLFNFYGLIGSNSSFGGLAALGGGGGQGRSSGGTAPNTGYNGGGGSYDFSTATVGNGGFAGGNSAGGGTSANGNGGGGGAGGVGVAGTTSKGGNGGPGDLYSISGFATRYAGGGGGSFYSTTDRSKIGFGTDGGGDGGYQGAVNGLDGVANTGGGGGGGGSTGSPNNNGRGGSGIIIVRYLT